MKRLLFLLLCLLLCAALCCSAVAESVGELPVFVAPEGVTVEENPAWERTLDGYSTRGWLLKGDSATAAQAIESYANSLEDYGFEMLDEVEPAGMNACYWFLEVDETGYRAAEINGYEFEVFVYGEVSKDGTQVAMMIGYVPGIEFQVEQTWESLFDGVDSLWPSAFDEPEEPEEAQGYVIPSFESYAQEVLTQPEGMAKNTFLLDVANVDVVNGYIELLEDYDIGGEDESEADYGFPYCFWLEDCDEEIEKKQIETVHGAIRAYVFFETTPEDGTDALRISVQYADGLTPKDLGDRWQIATLSGEELEGIEAFLDEYAKNTAPAKHTGCLDPGDRIVSNDGLVLVSPQTFFEGKYTFFIATDDGGEEPGWNWINYSFRGSDDTTEEEAEADLLMYFQALIDSGYYTSGSEEYKRLTYTGDRQVVVANSRGKEQNWQVAMHVEGGYTAIGMYIPETIVVNLVDGFTFADIEPPTVEEEEAEETPAPAVTVRPGRSGEERCFTCGGDGRVEQSCASCGGDGDRDCMSCYGKGYDNCSGCNGSGDRRCGRCYGTGDDSDGRCSNCYGTGRVRCSSCSGSGRRSCSACHGSGDRDCSSCGGDGRTERSCSSCGGDGWR